MTTASNSYMAYSVLDEELEGYLQLIKIDAETGKPVKIADTAFQIYKIAEDGTETLVEMNDPDSGDATAKTTTFYTDADGYLKTPEKLPSWSLSDRRGRGPGRLFQRHSLQCGL